MGLPIQKLYGLLVVSVPATAKNPAPHWEGKERFFAPESCARQLLVGTTSDKESLPETVLQRAEESGRLEERLNTTRFTVVKEGKNAYQYLLELVCGLQSQNKGEYHILGQFKGSWKNFLAKFPEKAKEMISVIQVLFEDANKIRHAVLEKLKVTGYEIAGANLAGVEGGEEVLVIAGNYGMTLNTARALGRDCARRVEHITVTHTSPDQLRERYLELKKAREDKTIRAGIDQTSMDDALSKIDEFDHVFVCHEMQTPLDQPLASSWEKRNRDSGRLVHLKGDPMSKGTSTGFWRELELKSLILPEQVREQFHVEIGENNRILGLAQRACEICAEDRGKGGVIREHQLVERLKEEKTLL